MSKRNPETNKPRGIEFVRGPKTVWNIGNISVGKIQKAYEERGINVVIDGDGGVATVTKTVLKINFPPEEPSESEE